MSAPSDGARADARKRLAAEVVASGDAAALAAALGDDAPVSWDFFPEPDLALDQIAAHVLASDWLAGVIADAKAEVREQIAMEIEAKAAGNHAAFAADEDEHLIRLGERYAGEWKPTYANRHDDGCGMCGLASAARIARGDS